MRTILMCQRFVSLNRHFVIGCWIMVAYGCGSPALHEMPTTKPKPATPAIPFQPEEVMVVNGDGCPSGTRVVTHAEHLSHAQAICDKLGQWSIVRLGEGGSADGHGYGCRSRVSDARTLGESLCTGLKQTQYQCFWMENYSGKYTWVLAPRFLYADQGKARCQALDSCNGGGGRSGGGCYKWSKGSNAPRESWD